jgi:hypothetical protein
MSQLSSTLYKRLTGPMVYGQSDGLYWDVTNSQLVMVLGDAIVARVDATGITADLEVSGNARGDLMRRGAAAWESLVAKAAGQIVIGDGTDVISAAVSGDLASISAAGAVTLANPQKLQVATVNLTETTIVGNSAGDIGHAAGVTLVAAVASKVIVPIAISINYTYATAAYTAGGNLSAIYVGGAAATGTVAAATSLGAGASNVNELRPVSGAALVNTALALVSSAAFTQPGTAAGTATVTTYYRLIDA